MLLIYYVEQKQRRKQVPTGRVWKGRETEWRREWLEEYRESPEWDAEKQKERMREVYVSLAERYGSWYNYLNEKKRLREERLKEEAAFELLII